MTYDYCYPKAARLLLSKQYNFVFAGRKVVKSHHFMLHFRFDLSQQDQNGARLGLVVGKQYLKKAVARNIIKRLARERFRLLRNRLPDVDLILRLCSRIDDQKLKRHDFISNEIDQLFNKSVEMMKRQLGKI